MTTLRNIYIFVITLVSFLIFCFQNKVFKTYNLDEVCGDTKFKSVIRCMVIIKLLSVLQCFYHKVYEKLHYQLGETYIFILEFTIR